ncbi:MAG: molybdenum cofactor guanylyltransferase [Vulcanococcus sp.]
MPPSSLPLRCCLLSGGSSRRMGQDKALLPHPGGGTWLEQSLRRLAQLEAPITLLSRWPQHLEQAQALALPQLEAMAEPPPWEGPLLALHRLMERHPGERLLLCPVDMPGLNRAALESLLAASAEAPSSILLAQGGGRCQPLLGIYPAENQRRQSLAAAIEAGERRLQTWLAHQPCLQVPLPEAVIRNVNSPSEL